MWTCDLPADHQLSVLEKLKAGRGQPLLIRAGAGGAVLPYCGLFVERDQGKKPGDLFLHSLETQSP